MMYDEFTLTEQHVKLLRRMNVSWGREEFGAPEIDPKRPYGNSNVYGDMARILGIPADGDGEFEPRLINLMDRLHQQTKVALQIVLVTGSFAPGVYRAPRYTSLWELAA
jgi:hypothetical protein